MLAVPSSFDLSGEVDYLNKIAARVLNTPAERLRITFRVLVCDERL